MNVPELKHYVSEFVAVTTHCVEEQLGQQMKNEMYAVEKPVLCDILNENPYKDAAEKLAIWKRLHWIETDKNHYTKSVYISGIRTHKRMIVLDLGVQKTLKKFVDNNQI